MTSAFKGDEFWHLMGRGNDSSDSLAASYLLQNMWMFGGAGG